MLRYLGNVSVHLLSHPAVSEDTLMFWKGIADVGLMEEVVCNIQKELEELLRGVQPRLIHTPFQVTGESTQSGFSRHFQIPISVRPHAAVGLNSRGRGILP